MLMHLVATLAVGLTLPLMVWAIFKTIRRPLPRYLMPLSAGLGILGFNIQADYTWTQPHFNSYPAGVVVAKTYTAAKPWKPWSYLFPYVERFVAVDRRTLKQNPLVPGYIMVDIILVERSSSAIVVKQYFDCRNKRFAALMPDTKLDERGLPQGDIWLAYREAPHIIDTACQSISYQ